MAECIFCAQRANSKEHFWGKWLQNVHKIDPNLGGHTIHDHDYRDFDGNLFIKKGWASGGGATANKTIRNLVCKDCNSGWMNGIQDAMKDIYTELLNGRGDLSFEDQLAIKNWFTLKVILHIARAASDGDATPAEMLQFRDETIARNSEHGLLFSRERVIPSSWRFNVARQTHPQVPGGFNYIPFVVSSPDGPRFQFAMIFYIFEIQAVVSNLGIVAMAQPEHRKLFGDKVVELTGTPRSLPNERLHPLYFQKMILSPLREFLPPLRDSVQGSWR